MYMFLLLKKRMYKFIFTMDKLIHLWLIYILNYIVNFRVHINIYIYIYINLILFLNNSYVTNSNHYYSLPCNKRCIFSEPSYGTPNNDTLNLPCLLFKVLCYSTSRRMVRICGTSKSKEADTHFMKKRNEKY